MKKANGRKRTGSVQKALDAIETDGQHHLTGHFMPETPNGSENSTPSGSNFKLRKHDDFYDSKGLWNDIKTLRWMRVPSSSFKILMIPIVLYAVCAALGVKSNPFETAFFISYYLPDSSPDDPRYGKGLLDFVFLLYHIVVFSFIRQFTLFKIIHPIARRLGIKKQAKIDRFGEQAYAILYYGTMGVWGISVMSKLPTWWYKTEHFFIDYPHWRMFPDLKRYYLMHFAYWVQQLIVLALKIEKPRKDFKELVAHHIVTLWMIGYCINLTYIGNAIFVSMDIPDVFLGLSKLCNYLGMERTKIAAFVALFTSWTYFRHWLNLRIIYSGWTQFDLIPEEYRRFRPWENIWLTWWAKYVMVGSIAFLQLLNLYWYFLIWRILIRTLSGAYITDDRSDDEGEGEDEADLKED